MSSRQRYSRVAQLALTFPSLEGAPVEPFEPEKFAAWSHTLSSGGQHAARFVLAVFNSHSAPARRIRQDLLRPFLSCVADCSYGAPDGPHDRDVDEAVQRYRDGDRAAALAAAGRAAALCPAFARLERWLREPRNTTEEAVLVMLDEAEVWSIGRFDLMDALGVWDDRHRAAFVAWARAPWWE